MDWSSERYVRVYTRDSTTWKILDWKARTVLMLMFRKVDRVGVLDVGGRGARGLAAILELPIEIASDGIAQLVTEACVVERGDVYVIPNFLEAQEAVQTPAHRSRQYRERKRARALGIPDPEPEPVTKSDATVTSRHATSRGVTPDRTVPVRTEPDPKSERDAPALSLVKPSAWVPEWTGALAAARELARARGVDVEAAVIAFTAHADAKRWTDRERPSRLTAWLAREKNVDPKRAKSAPRTREPPPPAFPNFAELTDEDQAAIQELRQRLATTNNLDAVAEAERQRTREAG